MVHNFPQNIYLCYKHKNVPDIIFNNLLKYNPGYQINFFDDKDCRNFLEEYFGSKYVDCFNYIEHKAIKADFWRVCILYAKGGIYCDIDIKPEMGINEIIEKDTIFLTSTSWVANFLNPIILIAHKKDQILQDCILEYIYKFERKEYSYWQWSICPMLYRHFLKKFNRVIKNECLTIQTENGNYQLLRESDVSADKTKMRTLYKDKIFCKNHYDFYNNQEFILKPVVEKINL
jgi:mannosyltransferase OCH1-like enzyme